jgi:signal transduction histidine kinase
MLDFARQSEFMRSQVTMNKLVEETIALIQHQIQSSGVVVQTDLEIDLPAIYADPNQMKQVILNLIQNALQAMPEGGELFIQTRRQSSSGYEGIALAFKDNGEGIPTNIIDRVFEPFFTTRPVGKGTGLGLSVIYGIVTDHGGHIDVESQPGQGSCFTVCLPVGSRERYV